MQAFLSSARRIPLRVRPDRTPLTVVLGNQAGDADSIISALTYAYYISVRRDDGDVLPMLPFAREELELRRETTVLARKAGELDLAQIPSLADADLPALHAEYALRLVLVDHNRPEGVASGLGECVTEILDHHMDDGYCPHVSGDARRIAFDADAGRGIGSTCTLVAEAFLRDAKEALDATVARLLLGVILVDTLDLSPSAGKATPRDEAAVAALLPIAAMDEEPDSFRADLYRSLLDAKFDPAFWAALTPQQRLRFDYKERQWGKGGLLGLSAVLMPLQEALGFAEDRPSTEVVQAMRAYAQAQGLGLLGILTFVREPEPRRELLLCAPGEEGSSPPALAEAAAAVEGEQELAAQRVWEGHQDGMWLVWFRQGNPKPSRKQIMPLLLSQLSRL